MFVRELAERLVNLLPQLAALQPLGGVHGHDGHLTFHAAGFFIQFLDGLGALAFVLPQLVEAHVDRDARGPGGEAGIALELRQPLPRLHPSFL